MGKRERYEPGTFCWVDLATTDPAGAKAFYGDLFGWEAVDMPAGEAGTYTMMYLDGDELCGLYEMESERREQGVPSHWFSYVSVEDADTTATRARELGGTVFGEVFDVDGDGRIAVIQDPTGAALGAWQPRSHIGARRVNDPGCLSLNQLNTTDPERAAGFYTNLFGWEISQVVDEPPYWGINNNGWLNGGMMRMPEDAPGAPAHWLVYFTVLSCDEAVAKARKLGGAALIEPMDIEAGRISVLSDPQVAAFAVFEGRTDE